MMVGNFHGNTDMVRENLSWTDRQFRQRRTVLTNQVGSVPKKVKTSSIKRNTVYILWGPWESTCV